MSFTDIIDILESILYLYINVSKRVRREFFDVFRRFFLNRREQQITIGNNQIHTYII
jgi:hypothetical protein